MQAFASLVFSCFSIIFYAFWVAFWLSFGILLESPSSLWRASVILLVFFGLLEPSVGSLCYFLWCLWLVRAVCGLGDRSGIVLCFRFGPFGIHFLKIRGLMLKPFWFYFRSLLLSVSVLGAVGLEVFLVMGFVGLGGEGKGEEK